MDEILWQVRDRAADLGRAIGAAPLDLLKTERNGIARQVAFLDSRIGGQRDRVRPGPRPPR
ncbi:hypothetical protein [Hoyosella subflava]|uniref:Uncharacterized protein n=1 Tax=Hoyosella subflava (strain DSM 45089 / JCM 17490 / NBRC 109087 / DQS3-9A1) TaxID=443218 RepID=F6EQN4_HOYSD|nr:hypothetical protein [Hoyosella subflava]AEF41910.1 hypothetical protein AS9A_3469 [Hoyosella subflava DQS3-9A1]